jgi:hypothetical protein
MDSRFLNDMTGGNSRDSFSSIQDDLPSPGAAVARVANADKAGPGKPGEVVKRDVGERDRASPADLVVRTLLAPAGPLLLEIGQFVIRRRYTVRIREKSLEAMAVPRCRIAELGDHAPHRANRYGQDLGKSRNRSVPG